MYYFKDGNNATTNNCNSCEKVIDTYIVKRIDINKYECLWCGEVHYGERYKDGGIDRVVFKKDLPSWLLTGKRKYEEV